MKTKLFIALILLFSCVLCSCQKSEIGSPTDVKSSTASNNAAKETVGHDTSTPDRAIIGHWIAQEKQPYSKTHLYVTSDKIITVTIHELPYKVINSDITKKTIKVYAGTESGGHEKLFSFSKDMNMVTKTITIFDKPQNQTFLFVDNKLTP